MVCEESSLSFREFVQEKIRVKPSCEDRASTDECDQWLLALPVETKEASFSSMNSLGKCLSRQIRGVSILFPHFFLMSLCLFMILKSFLCAAQPF